VSGQRLLVVADAKMLPALAGGLRDGGKLDVQTVPLSDPAGAQAAAEQADAVALFYGASGAPLQAALQSLAPKIRERGGRVVAVLQREQAAQRDECFRAGASDLLFMPMPKEQFVARLLASLGLSWSAEAGAPAQVSVATRTAASKVDKAIVSPAGVEAPAELPLKSGETVRLAWGAFQHWGLVVRGAPSAQIRFAGLAPDEEAQIRDWLSSAKAAAAAVPSPPVASAPAAPSIPAAPAAPSIPAGPAAPATAAAAAPPAAPTPAAAPAAAVASAAPSNPPASAESRPAGGRAAPASGPPPGFAERKPIRPQTRTGVRVPPPTMSAAGASGATGAPAPAASVPPVAAPPAPSVPAAPVAAPPAAPAAGTPPVAPAMAGLFDEVPAAPPTAAEAAVSAPAGPPWPVPFTLAACRAAAAQLLKDKTLPADTPPALAAASKKITGLLGSGERAALDKAGPESHFADAVGARIALEAAVAEGVRLYSSTPAPVVDGAAVAGLVKLADDAAARLQKEANAAIGKGQVESLQLLTATSAALSRDVLTFKETADRLRGIGAAPRLGAGALDPDVVLPGQAPRARPLPTAAAPVKAELRDFRGLDTKPGKSKPIIAALIVAGAIAAAVNGFYFGLPHRANVSTEQAGDGVARIETNGDAALVMVTPDWIANAEVRAHLLAGVLRARGVKKAILVLPSGGTTGVLDVVSGRLVGVPKPQK
jgi:hypothetical protein